jgi:hypothetical protein
MLGAIQPDTERDHATVLAEVHPVDHERDQVQTGQILGEQFGQGGLGGRHEPPRHRRAAGAAGGLRDAFADRSSPIR